MRLLPRRRDKVRDARPSLDPPTVPASAPDQQSGRAAGPAHWRRLAPLAPTVHRAPLTIAGTMGVFADEKNRPLIHAPGHQSRAADRSADAASAGTAAVTPAHEAAVVEPAAGRVSGLIVVRAEAPEPALLEPSPPAQSRARERKRAPVAEHPVAAEPAARPVEAELTHARLAPRVLPSAGPRRSLVKAADEYVGDPQPDSAPYASSAWLRMVESYRPPWAGGASAAPPGTSVGPPPIPEGGGSWSSEAAIAPPRAARNAPADAPRPARRASLAESRRLGLGSPLHKGRAQSPEPEDEDLQDGPEESEAGADTSPAAVSDEGGRTPLVHAQTQVPAVTPAPEPEMTAQPVTDVNEAAGAGVSPHPAPESPVRPSGSDTAPPPPRLGLAAPIDRPARRSRGITSEGRPTAPQVPFPPASEDPQPRPQTGGAAVPESGAPAEGIVESSRSAAAHPELSHPVQPQPAQLRPMQFEPAQPDLTQHDLAQPQPEEPLRSAPRRAVPVYRFAPGERPTQTAATRLRPTSPAPVSAPAPRPTVSAPGQTSQPTPSPTRGASSPGPTTPAATVTSPLTHPLGQRRSDVTRAEAEPQQSTRYSEPSVQTQAPASSRTPEPPSTAVDTVPYDLLDVVRRSQGIDVSDVPIRRGPQVADEARSLGARSFTRGAEVYLPADEGPPDHPVARGLLAHELTHAAQQRLLGSALPAEDSPAGRALEAQAVAAERWARGLGSDPADGGGAAVPPGSSWTAPWLTAPTPGVQRQTDDVTSVAGPEYASAPAGASAPTPDASGPSTADSPAPQPADHRDEELHAARDRLIDLSRRRPLDLDDPADIEELSARIYQKIHRRLRRELVVDRERAGRLGETGPFGPAR